MSRVGGFDLANEVFFELCAPVGAADVAMETINLVAGKEYVDLGAMTLGTFAFSLVVRYVLDR